MCGGDVMKPEEQGGAEGFARPLALDLVRHCHYLKYFMVGSVRGAAPAVYFSLNQDKACSSFTVPGSCSLTVL